MAEAQEGTYSATGGGEEAEEEGSRKRESERDADIGGRGGGRREEEGRSERRERERERKRLIKIRRRMSRLTCDYIRARYIRFFFGNVTASHITIASDETCD